MGTGVIRVDVLIVGGGLQDLLLLDECVAQGRSCALITNSEPSSVAV
jgi:hypothetical protein